MDQSKKQIFTSISDYISSTAPEVQERLNMLYNLIKEEIPQAEERMSWGMPTFHLKENLVHFFAHKHHMGFYPGENAIVVFQDSLKAFKTSKGAIQFPHNQPLPLDLIRAIVQFRIQEI